MIITEKLYKLGLYIIIVCYVAISVLIESSAPSTFQYFTQTIGVGPGVFAIITALYFIIAACMQIPGGVVLDVFGFNKVVPISMVGTILGLILYWYARNEFVIELANIIWGVSLSIAYLIGIYIIPAFFSAARIPLLLAILGIGATLGNLSAYAPLTYLINRIGWNTTGAIFIGILILLLILFMLITAQMPNYKPHKTKFQLMTQIKNIVFLCCNKYVITILIYSFSTWLIVISFAGYWLKFYVMTFNALSNNQSFEFIEFYWFSYILGTIVLGYVNKSLKTAKVSLILLSFISFICYVLLMNPNGFSNQKLLLIIFFAGFSASGILIPNFILTQIIDKKYRGVVLSLNSSACLAGAYFGRNLFSFILLDINLDYYFKLLREARMVSEMYPSLSIFVLFAIVALIASLVFFYQYRSEINYIKPRVTKI